MRLRIAIPVLSVVVLVVAGAIAVTAVRSEAKGKATAVTGSAVSLARVASGGSTVTVPALGGSAADTVDAQPVDSQTTADTAAIASSAAAASSSAASRESASSAAASSAARIAAASSAANQAAASKAAAASRAAISSSAAASRAAASSSAASSSAASSSAASSRASASSAASASKAAASRAASSSAASVAAAAQAASAAAHPAPDTSDEVQQAVDEAADSGITQSVVVMNKQTGSVTTSIDADADVPAMSLFKIIVATDVIDQAGGVDNVSSDTLAQLHQMIVASDDSIAQDFYDNDGQGAIVTRVAKQYGLTETLPSPEPRYWGDVKTSARDMGSLLFQLLSDDDTSSWFTEAMEGSLDTGADGFDQNFGVNTVPGAGSKQGWGCCLGDVMAIHSMGFTANQIIVVLSTAGNDVPYTKLGTAKELTDDPGAQASVAAVTRTVHAALPPS